MTILYLTSLTCSLIPYVFPLCSICECRYFQWVIVVKINYHHLQLEYCKRTRILTLLVPSMNFPHSYHPSHLDYLARWFVQVKRSKKSSHTGSASSTFRHLLRINLEKDDSYYYWHEQSDCYNTCLWAIRALLMLCNVRRKKIKKIKLKIVRGYRIKPTRIAICTTIEMEWDCLMTHDFLLCLLLRSASSTFLIRMRNTS